MTVKLDGPAIAAALETHGCSVTSPLLYPAASAALVASYDEDTPFCGRVIARRGFGRG